MHLVATNLGVWIKTLVHESTQEFISHASILYSDEISTNENRYITGKD